MTRVTVDYYNTREKAADAVRSLREVGMQHGDVASAWLAADDDASGRDETDEVVVFRCIDLAGGERVCVSGWLIDHVGEDDGFDLLEEVGGPELSETDVARLATSLREGGGVVIMRARDDLSGPSD